MKYKTILAAAALVVGFTLPASAATLDDVRAKGHVQCGVSQGLPGFSNPDKEGNWIGLDVDCVSGRSRRSLR